MHAQRILLFIVVLILVLIVVWYLITQGEHHRHRRRHHKKDVDPVITLSTAGGDETLVNDGLGPNLVVKGLTAGTGINLISNNNEIEISASDIDPQVTLSSAGGTDTLVNNGSGPNLVVKGLTPGPGISLTPSGTDIQISATGDLAFGIDYISAYDTTTQTVASVGVFQNVNFSNNSIVDSWVHTPATSSFTCPANGVYKITSIAQFDGSRGQHEGVMRITKNGSEILGSAQGVHIASGSRSYDNCATEAIVSLLLGDVIRIQITGNSTAVHIAPHAAYGIAVGIKMSIIRIA